MLQESLKSRRVLVALDGSKNSLAALQWYIKNMYSETDDLFLFCVVESEKDLQMLADATWDVIIPTKEMQEMENAREAAMEIIKKAVEMVQAEYPNLIKYEAIPKIDEDPRGLLSDLTEELRIDLLVVGSRGLGSMKRIFMGSVSAYCLHHVKCPVAIIKPR